MGMLSTDFRAHSRELSFRRFRVIAVQSVRDDNAEHRVAQELESLVGGQSPMLVGKGSVSECQTQDARGKFNTEA